MLLDSHGVGGQGGPGDGVGGHQEIEGGSQDWGEETGGDQGGNKSRHVPVHPKFFRLQC